MTQYYTIQIHLSVKVKEQNIVELHNIEGDRINQFWPQIYRRGVRVQHTRTTWEIISPLHIKTFFIIKQDGKI